jgi:sugar phosphate isomerase/epimerase
MEFGVCTALANAPAVAAAGFGYVEENIQTVCQGQLPEDEYSGLEALRSASPPVLAGNFMVPGSLKITGPDVDTPRLTQYMARTLERAGKTRLRTFVFGSGGARQVPEGWERERASEQIVAFGRLIAPMAAKNGITIALEPLRRAECNIINSVAEAMEYVRAVDHPSFQCLLDSYHFWEEADSLDELSGCATCIRHVHVADPGGRLAPGESGSADYRPLFAILKAARYDGLISVEARGFDDIAGMGPRVLPFLKRQWDEC